jgi:hypothetical protein
MVESKLVSIEPVLNATTERRQEFDPALLQSSKADGNASAFGSMLEDLISRVPSPSLLRQSDDLLAFIQYTGKTTDLELKKIGKLPARGSVILSLLGKFSERLVACTVVDSFCAKCANHSAPGGARNGDPNYRVKDIK